MNNSTVFIPVLPTEMQPQVLISSADYIVSRNQREYLPDALQTFSYSGNNRMTFTINSSDSFLDGKNSYLRFKLTTTATDPNMSANQLSRRYIDHCAHSLFSQMQIKLSNGTVIEDVQSYNKLYSILRRYTMSFSHVDSVEHISGDSQSEISEIDTGSSWVSFSEGATLAQTAYVAATQSLTLVAGNFPAELQIGDFVRFNSIGAVAANAGRTFSGTVASIISAREIRLAFIGGSQPAGDIPAGPDGIVGLAFSKARQVRSARNIAATTALITLKMKPFSSFLQNSKFLPLPLMKNLQIMFTLENPAFVVKVNQATPTTIVDYTISEPRFVASLVQPSEGYMNEILGLYNSDMGISLSYLSYFHSLRSQIAPMGQMQYGIPSSVRSARAVILASYTTYSESVRYDDFQHNTISYPSISTTSKNNLANFQFQVGSMRWPTYGPCDVSDQFNGDAFPQALQAFDNHGNILANTSIKSAKYFAQNPVYGLTNNVVSTIANDSERFICGAKLDRQGTATGVDLLNSDIQVLLNYSAQGQDAYLRSWVVCDQVLNISKSASIVMR